MQKVCTIDDVEQRPRRLMTCVNAIRGESLWFYREVSNARDVVILLRLSPYHRPFLEGFGGAWEHCRQTIDHMRCSRIVQSEKNDARLLPSGKGYDFTKVKIKC